MNKVSKGTSICIYFCNWRWQFFIILETFTNHTRWWHCLKEQGIWSRSLIIEEPHFFLSKENTLGAECEKWWPIIFSMKNMVSCDCFSIHSFEAYLFMSHDLSKALHLSGGCRLAETARWQMQRGVKTNNDWSAKKIINNNYRGTNTASQH